MSTYRIQVDAPQSRASDLAAYNQEADNRLPLAVFARHTEDAKLIEIWAITATDPKQAVAIAKLATKMLKVNIININGDVWVEEGCDECGQLPIVRTAVATLQGVLLNSLTLCGACALSTGRAGEGDISTAEGLAKGEVN